MMNFSSVTQLLDQTSGSHSSIYERAFLHTSIEKRLQETGCGSPEEYCGYLEQNPAEEQILRACLYNHFSEFFRDPLTFAMLERSILPELIQKKKNGKRSEIRIWSAGCAAGQEPYSLAILLEEALGNSHPGLTYRIFATDLDETQLDEARLGYYPPAALGNLSLKRSETWFIRQAGGYVVKAALQKNINFSVFDLIQEERGCPPASIFGDFDLVLCCNLLIYYQPGPRTLILDRFEHCLARGGTLVTDAAERGLALAHHFREVYPPAAIFQLNRATRKQT
jgi:chemotaxis methyl-accepting protein methylase